MLDALPFAEIWAVDFEFGAEPGENPEPVCLVAWELRSGRKVRVWRDEFGTAPPYPTGPDALFVAYYASAEISCHLALGWPVPERVLDLFTEFRNRTNGVPTGNGASLLGALAFHGLDSIGTVEKDEMRALVLRGGPWSDAERAAILDYCESDVAALARLLPAMLPSIDLPRALLRGRYMVAAARMERNGVPIDVATLGRLKRHWHDIQDQLIADIDADYGVFEGRTFKADRFATWLSRDRHPLAAAGQRPARSQRRCISRSGARSSSGRAFARVARRPVRNAAVRSGRRTRRPQPHPPVGVPGAHRPQSAEQHQIHFWPERLAARVDPTATGSWARLYRLGATRIRYRGGAVWRSADVGCLPLGRPLSCLRQTGGRGTSGCDQGNAQGGARSVQGVRAGGAVRHGRRRAGASASVSHRSAPGNSYASTAKPTGYSGAGPTRRWITPC